MSTRTGFAPVTLVLGEEELLAERAVSDAVDAARAELGPETTVEEVQGGSLPDGFAMGLATASLFGGGRVVVVQSADSLDAGGRQAVLAVARDPSPATVIVLRAEGVGRQGKFFKDLQEHANVVTVARLKASERSSWLRAEVRRLGRKADDGLVAALVDTVGQDLRERAGAPSGEVAQALGLRDWQVRKLTAQARRFHPSVLRRALDLIAETDAQIRNGTPSPSVALELVVARIAIAGAGGR